MVCFGLWLLFLLFCVWKNEHFYCARKSEEKGAQEWQPVGLAGLPFLWDCEGENGF